MARIKDLTRNLFSRLKVIKLAKINYGSLIVPLIKLKL